MFALRGISGGLNKTVARDQCVIDHMGDFPAIY